MSGLFDALSADARSRLVACAQPRWIQPMLATLTDEPFSDPGEWTRGGRLRHPRFLGLRIDRRAVDVRRERPET
jgi:hypothetical protein